MVNCFLGCSICPSPPQLDPGGSEGSLSVLSLPPALGPELNTRRSSVLRLMFGAWKHVPSTLPFFLNSVSKSVFSLALGPR